MSLADAKVVSKVHRRPYRPCDLGDAWLVIAASDSPEVNSAVFGDATKARIFVNVVDEPELCSFQVPSVATRGLLQIAVSTGGASPSLASALRRRFEAELAPAYSELLDSLMDLRRHVRRKYPDDPKRRRELLRSFVDSPAPALLVEQADTDAFHSEVRRWKSL